MANNSRWVLDELKEWLDKGINYVQELEDKNTGDEKVRLNVKKNALQMVRDKVYQLETE